MNPILTTHNSQPTTHNSQFTTIKKLSVLLIFLLANHIVMAQTVSLYSNTGEAQCASDISYTASSGTGNPSTSNPLYPTATTTTSAENDNATSGWTAIPLTGVKITANKWSSNISLPFDFYFYGEAVTAFKVSYNGILTFNTSYASTPPIGNNSSLSSSSIPDQSICFWDFCQTQGTDDKMYYKVMGKTPNRQLWVKWQLADMGGTTALTSVKNNFFAFVLEESTNNIYFVDKKKSSSTTSLSATLGLKYNSATYYDYNAAAILTASSANNFYTNNVYYKFTYSEKDVSESDTITYTSSTFSDKLQYLSFGNASCLSPTLEDANLFVYVNTGDHYNKSLIASGADITSLLLTVKVYDESCNELYTYEKDIFIDFSASEVEKLIKVNLHSDEINIENANRLAVSIARDADDDSPSSIQAMAWVDEDYTYNVNSGDYATSSLLNISEASVNGNLVNFSWEAACESNGLYQLQILRLYNTNEDKNSDPEYLYADAIDWSKTLSIEVENKTSLTLFMAEGSGYYAWRVRAIGDYYKGGIANSLNWGLWTIHPLAADESDYYDVPALPALASMRSSFSSPLVITSSSAYPDYIFYAEQADADKNWIYNRAFTERNSIAQGISYATGLGQIKQNQRLLQEQDSILVNQAAYDYCGRAAVQSLTAPYAQSRLGYVDALIQDESSTLYSPDDFDTEERVQFADDLGDVPVWENPNSMFGPINNYYSDKNEDINIPNAANFPYARTLYHQDGRVKKQSLFGEEHRMGLYDKTYDGVGLQRTIRTYYSAAEDTVLLKVFGNETPHDTNMYKVITVDPNERPFVEYKSIDGKTLATAYINTGQHPLVDDVWEDPSNRIIKTIEGEVVADSYTIVREQSVAFAEPTIQVLLNYNIDASDDIFNANCVNYCSTCDYTVYIYVIREETDELIWNTSYIIGADLCRDAKDFEATPDDTLTLSDPGVYRFGRKITVNKQADHHATEIGDKMDENVLSQYDDLLAYLQEENTDLDKLNEYFDIRAGISSETSSLDVLNENIKVSYDSSNDEYTLSTSCSEITIPKVECDEDVCDDYWIDYDSTDYERYDATVAELFKDDKGYYDFEKIVYEYASENSLADETGTAPGDYLYRYFFDQYGNQIYPTNSWYSEAAIYIKSGEYHANDDIHTSIESGSYEGQSLTLKLNDPSNLSSGTTTTAYENDFEKNENSSASDNDIIYDLSASGTKTTFSDFDCGGEINYASLHDYGDFPQCNSGTSGSDIYFTGAQLAASVYYNLSSIYTPLGFEISKEKTSDGFYKITIKVDHSASTALADLEGKLSLAMTNLKEADDNVYIEDFELHEPAGDFMYGNGALNAMLNHMIFDEEEEYNCIDIMLAMEQYAGDWQGLVANKGTTEVPGFNTMDYLLSLIGALESGESEIQSNGKQYAGFSDHEYGTGDGNVFLRTGLQGDYTNPLASGTSTNFGYGYLEYAYKSFPLNWQYDYFYSKYKESTYGYGGEEYQKIDNCASLYGLDLTNDIDSWSNPSGESLTDTNAVWDEETCGARAWWNMFTNEVIADDRFESSACKVWEQLYTCLQSDLDQVVETAEIEDTDGDGEYTDEFEDLVLTKMSSILDMRMPAIGNIIADENDTLGEEEVQLAIEKLASTLKTNFVSTANLSSTNDKIRLKALLNAQKLMSGKLNITFNSSAGSDYSFIPAIQTTKGKILSTSLNEKISECGCNPTRAEIKEWINDIADEKKIDISSAYPDITSKQTFNNTSFFDLSTSLGTSKSEFAFSAGKITFNDGGTTHNVMYLYNTNGGNEIYTVPPLGYALSNQTPIGASISLQLQSRKNCKQDNIDYLLFMLEEELEQCRQREIDSSLANYYETCTLPANIIDTMTIEYGVNYEHFTLFYYDINGNLVKTVPPKGVDVNSSNPSRMDVKKHTLATEYGYNSLGQKIYESTPDGGETEFWYNKVGQIRFSQNAEQLAHEVYSYIKYDELGRPTESGESAQRASDNSFVEHVNNRDYPTLGNTDKIVTVYSEAVSGLSYLNSEELEQTYLQNRVSYSYSDADGTEGSGDEIYTYFSYSPHGMVEWMLQSIPGLDNKYIEYEYDLISGKVTQLSYNPGKNDQFFHKYVYDSDNRIQKVQTSRDAYLWDTDAEYKYYAYGPLKRVSLGEDKVQGLDYTYTINGWLKGVNHQSLSATYDPGEDGASGSEFANDVFGYSLGYFEGDFKRGYDINKDGTLDKFSPFNSEFSTLYSTDGSSQYANKGQNQMDWYRNGGTQTFNYKPLFDGTITNMVYNSKDPDPSGSMNHSEVPQGFMFNYDELNRLTKAGYDYASGDNWLNNTTEEYLSAYSYDENGNIESLSRNANKNKTGTVAQMDELSYTYKNGTNKLMHVKDAAGATALITSDIETQTAGNYEYDNIGQLMADNAEGIDDINWTPAHKVEKVTFSDGKTISYTYNSLGHRTSKTVLEVTGTRIGPNGTAISTYDTVITYYVTDANGRVMGIYNKASLKDDATLGELPIYATSRIGEYKSAEGINADETISEDEYTRAVGSKYYEMNDHLGNVRAVVTDVKTDENTATVVSTADYYPYGMEMPERTYSSNDYRYGYQGKEKDDELKGKSNSYDFGARFYDPRLGRWLSLDPLAAEYPSESPYEAMGNNPINMVDPDGKEPDPSMRFYTEQNAQHDLWFIAGVGAGLVGAIGDIGSLAWYGLQANLYTTTFGLVATPQFRADQKDQRSLGYSLLTDASARERLAGAMQDALGDYWDEVTAGTEEGAYARGKLFFEVASMFIGVEELTAAAKLGKFSKEQRLALKIAAIATGCGCFTENTLVYTKEGRVEIKDIKKGDWVWAYDEISKKMELKQVEDSYVYERDSLFTIYFGNNKVETTSDHPFFIGGKWKMVKYLQKGDSLITYENYRIQIDSIIVSTGKFKVYNFSVSDYHNYYVSEEDILVHNSACQFYIKRALSLGIKTFNVSTGSASLMTIIERINGRTEHLTSLDISGAIRDIYGNPIINRKTGKVYQHLKEVEEALKGMRKELGNLTYAIDRGDFAGSDLEEARKLRSSLSKRIDAIETTLSDAKKDAGK